MKDAASSAQTQLEQQRTTVLQEAQSRVQQLEQEVQDYAVGKLETRTAELSKKVEVMLQNMERSGRVSTFHQLSLVCYLYYALAYLPIHAIGPAHDYINTEKINVCLYIQMYMRARVCVCVCVCVSVCM
mmetsp:Transcript_18123/g.30449  ORF Transcript_18123/g.30449 Transcript_18123/m.30449 type:complete len:129 (-) Transcript_18123:126-512(-)